MPTYPIYLDYNATTPIASEVAEAMRPYLGEIFGNPSSAHPYGRQIRAGVERARAQLAALLGCQPPEIMFTSGGTEANNTVIKGVAEASGGGGGHIVISAVEHPAVLEPCNWLAASLSQSENSTTDRVPNVPEPPSTLPIVMPSVVPNFATAP